MNIKNTKKLPKVHGMASPLYRMASLIKIGEVVFRDTDLAVIWGIINKNTLYTIIKRYTANGVLNRIKPGIYSIVDPGTISPEIIGVKMLHTYCYVSTETILRDEGIILQNILHTTFVSSASRKFIVAGHSFISRQLKDIFLYNDAGLYEKNGVLYATVERAVADLLYFDPLYYFDNERAVDWKKVRKIQKAIGYSYKR
jgi:predicted transcriptional regulator of viral defense system